MKMWGKKCPNCAKKIEKDFIYCPYCAFPIKRNMEKEDFGLFGKDDQVGNLPLIGQRNQGLPLPLDKILGSLMNQLGKELGNMDHLNNPQGRNFKIQISAGIPPNMGIERKQKRQTKERISRIEIPAEELERRKSLPRKEAESNVRRLSDRIIYEINMPGVIDKDQITITKLDNSYEIKAYSKKECYTKSIPIDAEMIQSYIKEGTLFLELKE